MVTENKALIRELVEEVWGGGNFAVVDRLVANDYVGHSSSSATENHGVEGYKQFFYGLRSAFPDIRFEIEDEISEGDRVVTRWTAHATHTGEFAGIPATGRKGTVTGTSIHRVVDGKVAECWTHSDDLGLLQQIGGIPAQGGAR